jgi:hypothetical protein
VSVEADARIGQGQTPIYQPSLAALATAFLDTIDPTATWAGDRPNAQFISERPIANNGRRPYSGSFGRCRGGTRLMTSRPG